MDAAPAGAVGCDPVPCPRDAIRLIKDNLDKAMLVDFETSLDGEAARMIEAGQSPDHKEVVRAFIEKRKPVFGAGRAS